MNVLELIRLIRRVNPTDRGLHPEEEARRYDQKTALQGLLIERHRGDLEVVGEGENLALLRHVPSGQDACHARISDLEEDTRRWVRRQVDEQECPFVPPADDAKEVEHDDGHTDREVSRAHEGPDQLSPAEQVRLGQEALAQYDFPAARRHFESALARPRGARLAALALLDLLVNNLAADHDALALETELPSEVAREPAAREALGLAAARLGEVDHALELVQGLDGEGAAEVYLTLARGAITVSDTERAPRWIELARECDANNRGIHTVEKDLAALQARMWQPMEEQILGARANGDDGEAARLARQLLERWPHSKTARDVLQQVREARRQAGLDALLQRADAALEARQHDEAARLYEEALERGAADDRAAEWLELARRRQQEAAEQELVETVSAAMRREVRSGLVAYARLEHRLRERVQARVDLPHLAWVDEMAPSVSPRQAAAAALVLEQTSRLDVATSADQIIEVLTPHEQELGGVPAADELLRAARDRALADRRKAAMACVEQAESALGAGEPERAMALWKSSELGVLEADAAERAGEVRSRIDRALDEGAAATELRRLLDRLDLFAARDLARRRRDASVGKQRATWEERLEHVQRQIRLRWCFRTFERPGEAALDAVDLRGRSGSTADWVLAGTDLVALVSVEGCWVFIQLLAMSSGRVERAAMLRTPEPLGTPGFWMVNQGHIWISGPTGWMIQLATESLEIVRWDSPRRFLPREAAEGELKLILGGRYAWLVGVSSETTIVDLERWQRAGTMPCIPQVTKLSCGGEVMGFRQVGDEPAHPCTERGAPLRTARIRHDMGLNAATVNPAGDGYVVVYVPATGVAVRLGVLSSAGELKFSVPLPELSPRKQHVLAACRRRRLVFVLGTTPVPSRELIAYRVGPRDLEQVYSTLVPTDTILAHDRDGERVVAVAAGGLGLEVVPLGEAPPAFRWSSCGEGLTPLPQFDAAYLRCGGAMFQSSRRSRELAAELRVLSPAEAESRVDRFREEHTGAPGALKDLYQAQVMSGEVSRCGAEWRWRPDPDFPLARACHCQALAVQGMWGEARRLLRELRSHDFDDQVGEHLQHLLGLAEYLGGDVDAAASAWRAGKAHNGGCQLDPYLDLLGVLHDHNPALDTAAEDPSARQVTAAIVAADAALEAGDAAGATAHVDHPLVWCFRERQGLARLAEAFLRLGPEAPADLWRMAIVLATYIQRHRPAYGTANLVPHEVLIPDNTWVKERLDGLADAASEWLERALGAH